MSPLTEDEIEQKLKANTEDIAELKEDVKELKDGQKDIMNQFLTSHNAILQSTNSMNQMMSQLIINVNDNNTKKEISEGTNETQLKIAKTNTKSTIVVQVIIGLTTIAGAIIGAVWVVS